MALRLASVGDAIALFVVFLFGLAQTWVDFSQLWRLGWYRGSLMWLFQIFEHGSSCLVVCICQEHAVR